MASKTPIEWTSRRNPDGTVTPGATWTPIRARVKQDAGAIARERGYHSLVQIAEKMQGHVGPHCEKVSEECEFCYSETGNTRCLPANGTGLPFDRRARDLVDVFVDENILRQPLRWRKPTTIFVCSQTDLFANFVPDAYIERVFGAMRLCPQHLFLVLTKRVSRALAWFSKFRNTNHCVEVFDVGRGNVRSAEWIDPLPNVWIGATAGTQQTADARLPDLIQIPAAERFVSCEPLLGPLDISHWLRFRALNWVIAGGESGARARPMHPAWARSLRDQCAATGSHFFFKQWGSWAPVGDPKAKQSVVCAADGWHGAMASDALKDHVASRHGWSIDCAPLQVMYRANKKTAGRLLDGCEWNEMPEVPNL